MYRRSHAVARAQRLGFLLILVAGPLACAAAVQTRNTLVCVVQDGALRNVTADVNVATGDTLLGGEPFRAAHPGDHVPYAASSSWYVESSPLMLDGASYKKYGFPRVLGVSEVVPLGEYQGVPIFGEPDRPGPYEIVYVPVRPGCLFQPYEHDTAAKAALPTEMRSVERMSRER